MRQKAFIARVVGPCFAILLAHASAAAQVRTLELHEVWRTAGDPVSATEFGTITGMVELRSGSIWIADSMLGRIISVDSSGQGPRVAARTGDGPGEVRAPTRMAGTQSGGVAVYDIAAGRFHLFSPLGSHERSIPASRQVLYPKGFAVTRDGEFLLSGGISTSEKALHRFDDTGAYDQGWNRLPEAAHPMVARMIAGGPISFTPDGTVLYSLSAPHLIQRLHLDEKQSDTIARDPQLLDPIGDDFMQLEGRGADRVRRFRWYYPQSTGIFLVAPDRFLNVVTVREEGRSVWEIYDGMGSLIVREEIAKAYVPWSVTDDGDILASYVRSDTGEHVAVRLRLGF
jgi:hypothetical protein